MKRGNDSEPTAQVTTDPIDARVVISRVQTAADGAVLTFAGVVRNHNDGRSVDGITYECYDSMARREMLAVVGEATGRFGVRVAAVHRVGALGVGDVSLFVAVSSAHRAASFDAMRYVVDEIKKRVPVWKKEHYCEGETRWVGV